MPIADDTKSVEHFVLERLDDSLHVSLQVGLPGYDPLCLAIGACEDGVEVLHILGVVVAAEICAF